MSKGISKFIKIIPIPKYQKEFEDRIIELGKAGATPSIMADELGVSVDQLEDWARSKKLFKQALSVAMTSSRAFHERRLIESYSNKDSNSTLIQTLLKANFGDAYQTSTYQPVGSGGRSKKQEISDPIDFQTEISALLKELRGDEDSKPIGIMKCKKKAEEQ